MPQSAPQLSTKSSTAVSGVYMLFQDDQLIYVGRSHDCEARIANHRVNGRPFDFHLIAPCDDIHSQWIERALVRATEPVQNKILFAQRVAHAKAPPPQAPMPEHPLMVINKTQARARALRFGLRAQFENALRAGELPFKPKNRHIDHPNQQHIITVGELYTWCEAQVAT